MLHYILFCSHVQVNNQSALEFYKKFGFSVIATEKQYYKRIEPSDAYVLEKDLTQSSGDKISVNEFCRGVF